MAGEAYWLATNAEREIAKRDELAAPLRAEQAKYARAQKRVNEAEAAVRVAGEDARRRLEAAEKKSAQADADAVSEAAKPGCRKNCADLLIDAKNRAAEDVRQARVAVDAATAKAAAEVSAAKAALAAMPLPRNEAPLPERLGLSAWAWDLIMAVLRSAAVVGGSIAVALALHPASRTERAPARERAAARDEVVIEVEPVTPAVTARNAAPVRARRPRRTGRAVAPSRNEREHVAEFLRAVLRPDPEASASLRRLYGYYPEWCEAKKYAPLPPAVLGEQLRVIIDALGLEVEREDRDMVVRGTAFKA